jgi:hypothetical protein
MHLTDYVLIYKDRIREIVNSIITKNEKLFYELQTRHFVSFHENLFDDVMRVIQEYGEYEEKTFIQIPDEGFERARVYETAYDGKKRIQLPLWTKEEGESDLWIYFLCSDNANYIDIEVYDIYVP